MMQKRKPFPDDKSAAGLWRGRRYYSLDAYFKNTYGYKIRKVAVDAGFTCPNRDGVLDTRGCIFCSEGGSGEFAVPLSCASAKEPYIVYFQAYTNTYGPVERLEGLYRRALSEPLAVGISIATRPDCLPPPVLLLLDKLKREYPDKFIWIELGLQTIHEKTALYIRRGYTLGCFAQAVHSLHEIGIPVVAHMILGLPGEKEAMMLQTAEYLGSLSVFGIKLQLLHVLRGTDLEKDYVNGKFNVLSEEAYLHILIRCIESLPPDMVIHRVTGDGPKELLLAPLWSSNKKQVLNTLHHEMKLHDSYQGKNWKGRPPYATGTIDTL